LLAYHLGFVVHDLDAVADTYRRLLGIERWRVQERDYQKVPWNDRTTAARLRIGYGAGAGLTVELIQVLAGQTIHSHFLAAHGEGLQHIGFWCEDVRGAVERALDHGGTITHAYLDEASNAVVQVDPSNVEAIVRGLDAERVAYVDPGLGGVQFEFVGPAQEARTRAWLKEDFDLLLTPPPWSGRK
jgi:catechol 2,3-dioxygenase-like lactoylglutathione lyase family enzyme